MSLITHPADKYRKSLPRLARSSQAGPESGHQKKWWRRLEWQALLLTGIGAAIFFVWLGDMSVRGEESRWATVGTGMLRPSDCVFPRQKAVPFLSRPPF